MPVIEALESGRAIDKILFQRNASGESLGDIRRLAKEKNVPIQIVPPEKLLGFTKVNHQGVLAFAAQVQYLGLQEVIDHIVSNGNIPFFLILDGVTDTRNIGAIARTCLCCGVQAIVIPDKGVGSMNEEAIKSSAGALDRINICRTGSLLRAVETLHLNGINVYASDVNSPEKVFDLNLVDPSCIILGSEGSGISPHLLRVADKSFSIPMAGDFNSLNVSVAAGIIMFEGMKQRMRTK